MGLLLRATTSLFCLSAICIPSICDAFVRSVEYVEIVMSNPQTSGSANLTKGQTVANSVPFASSMGNSSVNGFGNAHVDVFLTAGAPPTVTAQRGLSGGTLTVGVFVVEFDPTYVKVQQGVFSFAGGNAGPVNVGITAVSDLTRAALVFYSRNNFASGGNGFDKVMVEGSFSSTSQLSFQRNGTSPTINGRWYVMEALNVSGSYAFIVQPKTFTFSSSSGSTALAPAVSASLSFVVGSYRTAAAVDHGDEGAFRLYLTGCAATCGSVAAERQTGSFSTTVTAYVLTFSSGVAVQRGAFNYPSSGGSSTTQSAALSPSVSVPKTMVWNGFGGAAGIMRSNDTSGDEMYSGQQRLTLTNSTTVQGNRGAAAGTAVGSWETVEWGTATTAVTLASFEARGLDGAVELSWQTASELRNLGFHLYRASSVEGPYERITPSLIPGLGSSPSGARYRHRDVGLENGRNYHYKLEDVETTGRRHGHGPIEATPELGAFEERGRGEERSLITYGEPSGTSVRVLEKTPRHLVLELRTGGFYATPEPDGSVRITVPDFVDDLGDVSAIPVWRSWLEIPGERQLRVESVRRDGVETVSFPDVSVDGSSIEARSNGVVRLRSRRAGARRTTSSSNAEVLNVGYQGGTRKALVELSPLQWDPKRRELALARVLTVRFSFFGSDPARRERKASQPRSVMRRLRVRERGLYAVSFENVAGRSRRPLRTSALRLSRLGEAVPIHVEPNPDAFGPGSTLYFWSEGAALNPYDPYASYDLERGEGETMATGAPPLRGDFVPFYFHHSEYEENRYYQAGLLEARDLWLWDVLLAPSRKSFPFDVKAVVSNAAASLEIGVQGVSDFDASPDHHLRFFVNGHLLGEESFDGKSARTFRFEIPSGVLREGENALEIENVGDTGADYSMVMLDRFAVDYPRALGGGGEILDATFPSSGLAQPSTSGDSFFFLDVTEERPTWLGNAPRVFVEAGRRYLAVSPDAVVVPELSVPGSGTLRSSVGRADYLLVGPRAFLEAARPLVELRRSQGLATRLVATEDVYSELGFGESRPEAIRELLADAYHLGEPPPRYVLLLGDGSYDFKDHLATGVRNRVPPLMVKTSFLWTASDPAYASVNGDDPFPDLAIGRLPAANVSELSVMIGKILEYERSGAVSEGAVVLVADNPDDAGDFVAHAEELARGALSKRSPREIYLDRLGPVATRAAIEDGFDQGASLLSYIGHGGIHLWASENVFDTSRVGALAPQEEMPIVFTLNCLNGYFHFPYFDSLAEALVKAEGKGAVAAISPSGMSLDAPAHVFHRALVEAVLSGRNRRLGDAVAEAQANYAATGRFPELMQIYHLFGDPALSLR
jgi:hypothetical protein